MICVLILAALPVAMIVIGEYGIIMCHVHVRVCVCVCRCTRMDDDLDLCQEQSKSIIQYYSLQVQFILISAHGMVIKEFLSG